jgi:TRAP-type C4-dicarboxylate transport system substrate-binding protein
MKKRNVLFLPGTIGLVLIMVVAPFTGAYAAPTPTPVRIAAAPPPQVITLKAVTFIPKNTNESKMCLDYWATIEKKSQGRLKINYLGGPEVIPSVEQVEALRTGVVDIASAPGAYHMTLIPAAGAIQLTRDKPWEQRKSGFFDIMVELYEKINLRFLGRLEASQGFYVMTRFPVKNPRTDFKGRKIRTLDTYDSFLNALGTAGVVVPRTDIYTAMERGVIEGFLSNAPLVISLGQQEVIKYIIMPSLYSGPCSMDVNLTVWKKLPKDLQDLLANTMAEFERKYDPVWAKYDEEARAKLRAAKVQEITFSPEDTKWYVDLAYSTEWEDLVKLAPDYGPKLRKIIMGY